MVTRLCLFSNPVSSHSRRDRESLILDTDNGQIEIMVTEINGKQVRLGVDAPQPVNIVRSELLEADHEGRIAKLE